MPTYEYACTKCRHRFEEFQRISDPPVKACPCCGAPVMRIISGGAGLIFKGSGFYITDYRNRGVSNSSSPKPKGPSHREDDVPKKATSGDAESKS